MSTRKVSRMLLSIAFTLICIVTMAGKVNAYNTFNDHRCNRGVNLKYFINSDATMFAVDIGQGAKRWDDASTRVNLARVYSTSTSSIDIYYAYDSTSTYKNANAWTELVILNYGPINPYEYNWDYGRIYLNRANMAPNTERSIVIVEHEMGHVFGLAHTNNIPTNIMCQELYGRTAKYPSTDDLAGINHLYR